MTKVNWPVVILSVIGLIGLILAFAVNGYFIIVPAIATLINWKLLKLR